jgi:hypothetical protein
VPIGSGPQRGASSSRTLILGTIALAIALSIGNAVAQTVDFGFFDLRYQALNSNTHASIFGALSLAACLTAVGTTILLARRQGGTANVVLAVALAGVFLFRAWSPPHVLVLGLPFVAVALVLLWRIEGATRPLIRAGCLLLVASFAIHVLELDSLGGSLDPDTWAYQLRCLAKHNAELAGWVLVAGGLLQVVHGRRVRQRSEVRRPVPSA